MLSLAQGPIVSLLEKANRLTTEKEKDDEKDDFGSCASSPYGSVGSEQCCSGLRTPASAQAEIAVTGVVKDAPDKADGTPTYGITDESSITGTAPPKGYLLQGDYSPYVGKRITVYGIPRQDHEMRVLDVTRIG
jgi:hypothetical protein